MSDNNQSRHLSAGAGWTWFVLAVRATRLHAFRLFLIVLFYTFCMGVLTLVPYAGVVVAALFMPFGTILLGHATRDALANKQPGFSLLSDGWKSLYARKNLIAVGLVFGFLLIAANTAYGVFAASDVAQWQYDANHQLDWRSVGLHFPWRGVIAAFVIYIPGLMATWFSPLLCSDKHMAWGKALFYSFFGCLKNILPILVLGLVLVVSASGCFVLASELIDLFTLQSINMYIYFPLGCVVMTVVYATYWPMYDALFGDTQQDDVPVTF